MKMLELESVKPTMEGVLYVSLYDVEVILLSMDPSVRSAIWLEGRDEPFEITEDSARLVIAEKNRPRMKRRGYARFSDDVDVGGLQ